MYFQIIDEKQRCDALYAKGQIIENPEYNDDLSCTWSYHPLLKNLNIQYGKIYAKGKTLNECCPEYLKKEWNKICRMHFIFQKSLNNAKISLKDYCFYDMVPENFLLEFFEIKNKITEHVISNFDRPKEYQYFVDLSKLLYDIKYQPLNLDFRNIDKETLIDDKITKYSQRLKNVIPYIDYNQYGSVTGRLTTNKNTFPILNISSAYRSVLKPRNDAFIEIDYNASQLRVLLALNKQPQSEDDLHNWHYNIFKKVYKEDINRGQVKTKMFGWLYGPSEASLGISEIEKAYNKKKVIDKFWDGEKITDPYGNQIKCDYFHALSYLIQSTEANMMLRRAIEIYKILEEKKSCIAWLCHDSIMIDFSLEDKPILKKIVDTFANTCFGKWKVKVKIGKNFGHMKDLNI